MIGDHDSSKKQLAAQGDEPSSKPETGLTLGKIQSKTQDIIEKKFGATSAILFGSALCFAIFAHISPLFIILSIICFGLFLALILIRFLGDFFRRLLFFSQDSIISLLKVVDSEAIKNSLIEKEIRKRIFRDFYVLSQIATDTDWIEEMMLENPKIFEKIFGNENLLRKIAISINILKYMPYENIEERIKDVPSEEAIAVFFAKKKRDEYGKYTYDEAYISTASHGANRFFGYPPFSKLIIGSKDSELLGRMKDWVDNYEDFTKDMGEVINNWVVKNELGRAKIPLIFNDNHPNDDYHGKVFYPMFVQGGEVDRDEEIEGENLMVLYLDIEKLPESCFIRSAIEPDEPEKEPNVEDRERSAAL